MKQTIVCIIAAALLLASCSSPADSANSEVGSLSLSAASASAKSILPATMTPASYTASGTSVTGAIAAAQSSSSGYFEFSNLTTGSWTFTIEGLDSSSNVILTGTKAVTISVGETADASLTLSPASGNGTLSLSLSWTSTAAVSTVTGTLTSSSGDSTSLAFTVDSTPKKATYSDSLAAGSYELVVTVMNGTTVVASSPMESVLVYNAQSSSWSSSLADGQFVSTGKDILSFSLSLPDGTLRLGSISGTAVSVTLPSSTVLTSLTPTIGVSTGASVSPASGVAADFSDTTNGVAYTVTAADGSTQVYTVKVTE